MHFGNILRLLRCPLYKCLCCSKELQYQIMTNNYIALTGFMFIYNMENNLAYWLPTWLIEIWIYHMIMPMYVHPVNSLVSLISS